MINARGPGGQHYYPVEPQRHAGSLGHDGQGRQQVFIDGIALAINFLLDVHFLYKAAALFCRIGQFAKAIAEFNTRCIKLKSFGHARVMCAGAGQSGLNRRIFIKHAHAPVAQLWLTFEVVEEKNQLGAAIKALEAKGMKVNSVGDKTAFMNKVRPIYAEYEAKIGKDVIDAFSKVK